MFKQSLYYIKQSTKMYTLCIFLNRQAFVLISHWSSANNGQIINLYIRPLSKLKCFNSEVKYTFEYIFIFVLE